MKTAMASWTGWASKHVKYAPRGHRSDREGHPICEGTQWGPVNGKGTDKGATPVGGPNEIEGHAPCPVFVSVLSKPPQGTTGGGAFSLDHNPCHQSP